MIKFEHPINGRYYWISLGRDLLDDHVITVIRGGVNRMGGAVIRRAGYRDLLTACAKSEEIIRRRLKRGYLLVA